MSGLPTPTIDSPSLSLLAAVTSRAAGIDQEELPSAKALTLTETRSTEVKVATVVLPVKADLLADATLFDVEMTAHETNPTRKPKVGSPDTSVECSRLKRFRGLAAVDLSVADLRSFCSRQEITGGRKATKATLCRKVCIAKAALDLRLANGDEKVDV
jgi:hypothetical protein